MQSNFFHNPVFVQWHLLLQIFRNFSYFLPWFFSTWTNILNCFEQSIRPLNPKRIGLRRMLFLVLQKEEKGLLRSNSVWHSIRFRHWPSCSFCWQFYIRRDTWLWLFVLHWSFFWRSKWRRLDTMCKMFQMGAHTLLWCGGRFCSWTLSRINRPSVLFIVYILCFVILCIV
jgi:hypothetical protein